MAVTLAKAPNKKEKKQSGIFGERVENYAKKGLKSCQNIILPCFMN